MAQNQPFASRNNSAYPYLLRALVSCGTCHLACTGRSSRGGYAYYVCNGRHLTRATRREEKCPARTIPVEHLDELVWQDVCLVLSHPEQIAQALAEAQGGHWLPQALQARREHLRKARVSVQQQLERLTDAYLAKVLDLDEYKRRRQELEQRRHSIAEQVRHLEVDVQRHDELSAMVESIEVFCQRVAQGLADATFEQKRQLIELLVDRVIVTDNEVEIRYVIPTSPGSEQIRFCHLRLDYFNKPVFSIQLQQTLGIGLVSRDIGYPIHEFSALFPLFFHGSAYLKDLCNPSPLFLEPFVHLRTRLLTDVYFYRRRRIIDVVVKACAGSLGHAFETIVMVCLMDPVSAAGAGEMQVP